MRGSATFRLVKSFGSNRFGCVRLRWLEGFLV
jgi:hypothetical protein